MTNVESQKSIFQRQFSRRNILTGGARLGVGVAATSLLQSACYDAPREISPLLKTPDSLHFIDNTLLIDFAYLLPGWSYQQKEYFSNFTLVQKLMRKQPLNLMQMIRAGTLLSGGFKKFSNHAIETVIAVQNHVLSPRGYYAIPYILPVQEGFDIKESDMDYTDRIGNKGIKLSFKADPIIERLANYYQNIVNISFQLGNLKILQKEREVQHFNTLIQSAFSRSDADSVMNGKLTQDEYEKLQSANEKKEYLERILADSIPHQFVPPKIKKIQDGFSFVGGYCDEDAESNIKEMFKLATAFQDKLFIVAMGNGGDDIRELREKLQAEWPENILFIGQWDGERNHPTGLTGDSLGADIYVDNIALGLPNAKEYASASTSSISACANILAQYYSNPLDIKRYLLDMCNSVTYTPDPSRMLQYDAGNLTKVIDAYVNPQPVETKLFNFNTLDQSFAVNPFPFE